MSRWRQRLRAAIAVFGAAFAVLLYFAIRDTNKPGQANRGVDRVDPAASAEGTRGEVRNLTGKGENYRIKFERSLAYADGRQKLTGVTAFIPQRAGRDFTVKGREAEVGPNQEHVQLSGGVELTASDGLVARTDAASFTQTEGILRAPGPTEFTRAKLSGTSVGMTYDKNRDVLWLLDQAVLKLGAETADDPPVDITSGAAGMARGDHYARFERGFTLVSGGRTLTSELATAFLTDDGSHVRTLEMRGNSRITGLGEGPGAARAMQADDINLEFAEDGKTLQGATLARNATIELAGDGGPGRLLAAQWIDVRLGPDGTTVTGLTARDSMELTLPASGTEPARVIKAASLSARGEGGKGLTAAKFVDNVEYRELRPAGSGTRTRRVVSRTLDLGTKPGLGEIDEARFSGAVRFDEDQLRAAAAEARYFVPRGVVELEGTDETTGLMPRMSDAQTTIDARRLSLELDGRRIVARDEVRSTMAQAAAPGGQGAAVVHRAAMLKQDQPVYGASTTLTYDGSARLAVYVGDARLWQGDTAIQADTITMNDASGNLTATGKVRSTLMLEQRDEGQATVERVPTIGSAEELAYEDVVRRATYRTGAHVAGPQGDLRATRVELYLKPSGSELDRVEAYTAVTLLDRARTATGDRLTFFTTGGRYVMTGSPVQLTAECRETAGRTLTFYKSADTIAVDGNEETRTQTKGGSKCGDPRLQ